MQNDRIALQTKINNLSYQQRNQEHQYTTEYAANYAMAQTTWIQRKKQFDHTKLNKLLPSRRGIARQGTRMTQFYHMTRPDRSGISEQVGDCVADVVDAVESIAQGVLRNEYFSEPFTRPEVSLGFGRENLARMMQKERELRARLDESMKQMNEHEDFRKKAWRKVMKTKAEFELPEYQYMSNGAVRYVNGAFFQCRPSTR
jgi:hypothetical protein